MVWTRRNLMSFGAAGLGALTAGCDRVQNSDAGGAALNFGNWLSYRVQRLVVPPDRLAPEFPESAISAAFRANGTVDPPDLDYKAHVQKKFVDWRLQVTGLVEHPQSLSLDDIRALPARTQITRHDCVEGWSCIGQWTGAPLFHVLDRAGLKAEARFLVMYCADSMDDNSIVSSNAAQGSGDGGDASDQGSSANTSSGTGASASASDDEMPDTHYYTSIDLIDARHPQTILAYEMNGAPLDVPHGAPLRLRVERQLGYKMPKYLQRIDVVDDFRSVRGGHGGYWEDQGYDWFAGV